MRILRITREKAISFSIIHFIVILQHIKVSSSTSSKDACRSISCGSLQIRFPFYLKDRQPDHCGYPGFELSCTNNSKAVVQLPFSGKFFIRHINYVSQSMEIYDQNGCIPRRLINFSLSNTPFNTQLYGNYSFFNCSTKHEQVIQETSPDYPYLKSISCLSSPSSKSEVFLLDFDAHIATGYIALPSNCWVLAVSIKWPYKYPYALDTHDNQNNLKLDRLLLNWDEPKCGTYCEIDGRTCGYKYFNSSHAIKCFRKPKGKNTVIGVSVGIFLLILLVLIIFIKLRNKADKEEKENQLRIEQFLENNALKPTRYSHVDIKKITNKFETKLGEGGYGSVFEGRLSNGIQVAVKVLDNPEGSNNGEEFVNEVATIGRIHHLNVVRLLGFCVEGSTRALIYEFMLNSSLDKFLFSAGKDKTSINLGWAKLQEISIGIARGMEYLHQGCDQRILHFDIKPQNILLDHNFTPKISDFGLAKLCTKDTFVTISMAAARGTIGYIAPEVFSRNFGTVSYKSDVYSFGMLLLEMVGGKKNTEFKAETHPDEQYFPEWIYNRLSRGEGLGIEAEVEGLETVKKLAMVALWCIQWNPVDRPTMNGVLHMLEGDTENLHMAPNPFASTTSVSSTPRVNHKIESELAVILKD